MRGLFGLAVFALAFAKAFALNVDSLPVWNPAALEQNSSSSFVANENGAGQGTEYEPAAKGGLETHGYKTLQVTVGDGGTQVDQELRLSIQGYVGDSVYIDALLNDVDRKAGNQTTATLQEVDQVYFRALAKYWMVHLGDLTWKDESMGLYSMERSTLGAMVGLRGGHWSVRGAMGTDEVNRKTLVLKGVGGQRSGYAISGDGAFVSVVPESETVWLNGVKLRRGTDYVVNYAGGLLDFKGRISPSADDEIRIEYDAYEDENVYNLYAAKGQYRHPNVYLDVSGFRLENDRERLKRGFWTEDEYHVLKRDEGDAFADSLDLKRPERMDRMGARMRLQGDNRFYADLELAMNREDSNIVSSRVDGRQGMAYRWFLTTDSSEQMKKFPVAFSVYGNFVEQGFDISKNQGSDMDWNSYKLLDEWDLDSSAVGFGNLRHDEFGMRFRLGGGWFTQTLWGYRQGEQEKWNSSRAKIALLHKTDFIKSEVGVVRVASLQESEMERYQALGSVNFLQGFFRPFGDFDLRYTNQTLDGDDSSSFENQFAYGKSNTGFYLVGDHWNASEAVTIKLAMHRGDFYDEDWSDSLKSFSWTQTAEYMGQYFDLNHFLQYERRLENQGAAENNWTGDLNARFGRDEVGIVGSADYKLGLTEEQTYTAIYKAVAPGTGDVRYDSLTGVFIEGVDNGDFVYEGLGRNDSLGATLASNAAFAIDVDMYPGMLFGVRRGILRDIALGGTYRAEAEDTTGKKLYFPAASPHELRKVSSGSIYGEARVRWEHSLGLYLGYRPSAMYDKKLSSMSYFEKTLSHNMDGGFKVNENHLISGNVLLEKSELSALQQLEWEIQDYLLLYRFSFLDGFYVEPGGRFRVGDGQDDMDYQFDAHLWEGLMKLGFERDDVGEIFVQFSAVQRESGDDIIPYQMMSGYGEGRTYRVEASASIDVNDFLSFGLHYVLRFGNAEQNIFQKLTTEAKAYF